MHLFEDLISTELLNAISYTLIHSLWQAPVIALLMFVALKNSDTKKSTLRYNLAFASLLLIFGSAVFTFLYYYLKGMGVNANAVASSVETCAEPGAIEAIVATTIPQSFNLSTLLESNFDRITYSWMLGVALFSIRIIVGQWHINHIKSSLNYGISEDYQIKVNQLSRQLGISKVIRVASSHKVQVPMMMGHIRPIIILPIAAINHLSIEETETILAHEIGHIMRNDFIQNIIVLMIESLFFFNPAVWWVCNTIRTERENSCDDLSMFLYPNRFSYARTLVKLQNIQDMQQPILALQLFKSKNHLLKRIKRVLNQPNHESYVRERGIATALLFISLVTLSSATNYIKNDSWVLIERLEDKPMELLTIVPKLLPNHLKENTDSEPISKIEVRIKDQEVVTIDVIGEDIPTETYHKIDLADWSNNYSTITPITHTVKKLNTQIQSKTSSCNASAPKQVHIMAFIDEDDSYRVVIDTIDEEDLRLQTEKMEMKAQELERKYDQRLKELEKDMEQVRIKWEKEHASEMKELEKKMEKFGEEFSERFDNDEWKEAISELSENISNNFDEEWTIKMETLGEEMSNSISQSLDNEWIEDIAEMGTEIAALVTESMFEEGGLFHEDEHNFHFEYEGEEELNIDNHLKEALIQNLTNDGFWGAGKNKFKITKEYLKVNGVKYTGNIYEKYKNIVQDHVEGAFEVDTTVEFDMRGTDLSKSNNTKLSISIDN